MSLVTQGVLSLAALEALAAPANSTHGVEIVSCQSDGCQNRSMRPLDHEVVMTWRREEKLEFRRYHPGTAARSLNEYE